MAGKDEECGGAGHCLGAADFKTLNFFRLILLCYVYVSVLPECMHMLYYVYAEARRGCQISWDLGYHVNAWN